MAFIAPAVTKTVSNADSSGILTVTSTAGIYLDQYGWLSQTAVETRSITVTEVIDSTTFRARFTASTGRVFDDLSAYDGGGATFSAPEQVVDVEGAVASDSEFVVMTSNPELPEERVLTAGAGLTLTDGGAGGAATLNVVAQDASIVVAADSIRVGVLQTDASHGNLGGGALHAVATQSVAGFQSAADKQKQDAAGPSKIVCRLSTAGVDLNAASWVAAGAGVGKTLTSATVATTNNNFDGVAAVLNDRILVADIAAGAPAVSNGAYKVTQAANGTTDKTILTRVTDLDESAEILTGTTFLVTAGNTKAGVTYGLLTAAPITVDVTQLLISALPAVLATDAQHGARGGGSLHAVATISADGFESAADKTKLDGISAGATVGEFANWSVFADAGNVGGGEDALNVAFIPPFTVDGQFAHFEFVLTFAANANSKQVKAYFATNLIYDSTAQAQSGGTMVIRGTIVRVSATVARVYFTSVTTAAVQLFPTVAVYISIGTTTTVNSGIYCSATAVDTDDIVNKIALVTSPQRFP